jgi:hypothetical protein
MTDNPPFTKNGEKITVQQLSDHIDFIIAKVRHMANQTWVPRQSCDIEIARELNSLRRDITRLVEAMIRSFTFTANCIKQSDDPVRDVRNHLDDGGGFPPQTTDQE